MTKDIRWLSKRNIGFYFVIVFVILFAAALLIRFNVSPRIINPHNTKLADDNVIKKISIFYNVLYNQIDKDKGKEALAIFGAPEDSTGATPIYFGLFDWEKKSRQWQERFSLQLDLLKPDLTNNIKSKTKILVIKDLAREKDLDLILTLRQNDKDNTLDTWVIRPSQTSAQVLLRVDLPKGEVSYKKGIITVTSIVSNTIDDTQKITTTYGWDGTKLKELETKREKI